MPERRPIRRRLKAKTESIISTPLTIWETEAKPIGLTFKSCNAIERLREKEYIEKKDRKIVLTDRGREVLNEYMTIIRFMSAHLSLHCGTSEKQAYEDALNATCAFSDVTRNGVANFIKSEMKGAHQAPID